MTGVDARVSVDLSLSCQRTETMSHKEEEQEEIKRILCFLNSYSRLMVQLPQTLSSSSSRDHRRVFGLD